MNIKIEKNHSIDEYNRRFKYKSKLSKFSSKEVLDYEKKYNKSLLVHHSWWFIDGYYYQVPRIFTFTWFRNLKKSTKIISCVVGVVAIATATTLGVYFGTRKSDINITVKTDIYKLNTRLEKKGNSFNYYVTINESGDDDYLLYLVNSSNNYANTIISKPNIEQSFLNLKDSSELYVAKRSNAGFATMPLKPKVKFNDIYYNYYDLDFTKSVDENIASKKSNRTFNNPLIISNPYGTDVLSTYFYFNTDYKCKVVYKIVTDNKSVFNRTVLDDFNKSAKLSTEHEFLARGLIEIVDNNIVIETYNENDKLIDTFFVNKKGPALENSDPIWQDMEISKETFSNNQLSNGLYAFNLGQEKVTLDRRTSLALMDNDGNVRCFFPMNDAFFINIRFINYNNKNCLIYLIDYHQLAIVDYLGRVEKVIELNILPNFSSDGKFSHFFMNHDFDIDENGNLILLVGRATSAQLEKKDGMIGTVCPGKYGRYVIRYNLFGDKKDTIEVLLDMYKSILPTYMSEYVPTLGLEDWFHANTCQYVLENNEPYLIISSRETSLIAKVKLGEVLASPDDPVTTDLKYIITENQNINQYEKNANYLTKTGTKCLPILGQHSSFVIKDNIFPSITLKDNQYYMSVFSNNSKVNFSNNKWDIDPEISQESIDKKSLCNIYLIDENTKRYSLVQQMEVQYSQWMSSLIRLNNGNWLSGSSANMTLEEFTYDGKLISRIKFNHNAESNEVLMDSLGYRGFKIDI